MSGSKAQVSDNVEMRSRFAGAHVRRHFLRLLVVAVASLQLVRGNWPQFHRLLVMSTYRGSRFCQALTDIVQERKMRTVAHLIERVTRMPLRPGEELALIRSAALRLLRSGDLALNLQVADVLGVSRRVYGRTMFAPYLPLVGHRRFIAIGSISNPYIPMMYSQLDQHGFSVHFVHGLHGILSALAEATDTGEIPHLHLDLWFTTEEAKKIVAALPNGATLSVTAHDLEHNVTRPNHQSGARIILRRADAIHLLTSSSRTNVLSIDNSIGNRMFHVPHPSYVGSFGGNYALPQDRSMARRTLGRSQDEFAVGLVGRISDRKNVDLLIAAGDILQRDSDSMPTPRIYISGSIASRKAESIVRSVGAIKNMHLMTDDLDDQKAGLHIAALDVAVVPYHAYLNSGWTLLALTAGLPVIASRTSTAHETVPPEALVFFDEGDADSLAAAIRRSALLDPTATRVAALARAAAVHPDRVAHQFAKELSARILQ